jgi:hypothetical protein
MSDRGLARGRRQRTLKALLGLGGLVVLAVLALALLTGRLGDGVGDGLFGGSPDDLFVDDDDSEYEDAIEQLARAEVTSGCGPEEDRTFCPDDAVTRGEFAVFLDRVLDLPAGDAAFEDVPDESFVARPVGRLASAGIVNGCGETTFCPGDEVTRGEAAVFVSRVLGQDDGAVTAFDDVPEGSLLAVPVGRLAAEGIVAACEVEPLRFCPDRPVTRGEVADLLVRAGLVE